MYAFSPCFISLSFSSLPSINHPPSATIVRLIILSWCLLSSSPFTIAYIVNHSKSYTIAAIVSWIEFWLEYLIFREKKLYFIYVCYFGIICTVLGQVSFFDNFIYTIDKKVDRLFVPCR